MISKLTVSAAALTISAFGAAAAPTVAQAQDAEALEITLLHGIPGFEADVSVDGTVVIEDFEPGDITDLQAFASETLTNVEVRAAGTDDIAIGPIAELEVPESGAWTFVAHLDEDGSPVITPFENDLSATAPEQALLTVRHVAAAPAVDVIAGDERVLEGLANGSSEALTLPVGTVRGVELALTGEDPAFDLPAVELVEGGNLVVYAVGSLDDETLDFYTQERTVGVDDSAAPADEVDNADGTPEPSVVNTGGPLDDGRSTLLLLALVGTAGLATITGIAASRRSAQR